MSSTTKPTTSGSISGTFISNLSFVSHYPHEYQRATTLMTEVLELLTRSTYRTSSDGGNPSLLLCITSLCRLLTLFFGTKNSIIVPPGLDTRTTTTIEQSLSQAKCLAPGEQAALVNALVNFTFSPRTGDDITHLTSPLLECSCDATDPLRGGPSRGAERAKLGEAMCRAL
ncbi:hypothetical protein BDV98DRAFT_576217 [Pterulicium gracile]|uniref:Uncharacterized protein n=1 Tax=Pterulicium gracile TaxID=1884261 RepID=A0A5C3Q4E0_9AGAR|nr:hypothetical protein BDV98DRAFT_576217 [Pterula gracilis]